MGDPRFPDSSSARSRSTGIDPGRLVFEITETAAIANMEQARAFAERLAGSAAASRSTTSAPASRSFYYLKYLPLDYLKIDGDFIRALPHSRTDQLVVKSMVHDRARAGHKTIAEFVERRDDAGHAARDGRRLRPGLPPGQARAGLGPQGRVIRSSRKMNDS